MWDTLRFVALSELACEHYSREFSNIRVHRASVPEGGSSVWSMFDSMPAWGISLLVHVGIIIIVAMISLPEIVLPEFNLTSTVEMEEISSGGVCARY
jgi:hypothetical protein